MTIILCIICYLFTVGLIMAIFHAIPRDEDDDQ